MTQRNFLIPIVSCFLGALLAQPGHYTHVVQLSHPLEKHPMGNMSCIGHEIKLDQQAFLEQQNFHEEIALDTDQFLLNLGKIEVNASDINNTTKGKSRIIDEKVNRKITSSDEPLEIEAIGPER